MFSSRGSRAVIPTIPTCFQHAGTGPTAADERNTSQPRLIVVQGGDVPRDRRPTGDGTIQQE